MEEEREEDSGTERKSETLEIKMEPVHLKDFLSEDFKEKFEEHMDMDLRLANMIFANEDSGLLILSHSNPENEEEGILNVKSDSEKHIEGFEKLVE